MFKKSLLFSFLGLAIATNAQEDQSNKIRLQNIQLQGGAMHMQSHLATPLTFQRWAPGSNLPAQAFAFIGNKRDFGTMRPGQVSELTLTFGKDPQGKGLQRQYRVGIMHSSFDLFAFNSSNRTATPYDTLTSGSGNTYPLDSVNRTDYRFNLRSQQTAIDVNVLWATNRDARFNFYFGGSLSAGFSWNTVNLSYRERVSIESRNSKDFREHKPETEVNERYALPTGFNFSIGAPVGVSFNLGRQNKFWSKLALTAEARPGFNLSTIQDEGIVGTGFVTRTIGLRFKL